MRKLYQILYNVGRLTDAPGGGRFLSRGDTLAVELFPFLGDTLAVGFPFRGDTLAWASLRGGKALGVTKPAFPPRAPPFRARRCSALWYVTMYWKRFCILRCWLCGDCADGCVVNGKQNSSYLPYPREQARCAGRFPVRRNKKIGSA